MHDPWCLCFDCVTADDERVAQRFHEAYERLAPVFGYETSLESRLPWKDVPKQNRALMIAVVHELIEKGVIRT